MTRAALALMWLLHFLPLRQLEQVGEVFGALLYRFGKERRRVTLTNLRLCFPQMTDAERERLARRHFGAFGRSFVERGLLWWASPARLRRLVRIEGLEHLAAQAGRPVILLVPHFVGLDMGWARLAMESCRVSDPSSNMGRVVSGCPIGIHTLQSMLMIWLCSAPAGPMD